MSEPATILDFPPTNLVYIEDLIQNAVAKSHPVLIVPSHKQAGQFAAVDIPAISTQSGDWSKIDAQALMELNVTDVCFYSEDAKWIDQTARVIDGYTKTPQLLKPNSSHDCLDRVYDEALMAPDYEFRDFDFQSSSISLEALMVKKFPPIKWIIPEVLPEGLTVIAGPSKLGKSWLTLAISLAVKFGGTVLNEIPVESGDVLLWALEDSQRRLQSRIQQMNPYESNWGSGKSLTIVTSEDLPPQLDKGGLERIAEWADSVTNPRLVVIDVWEKVAPDRQSGEKEYTSVYKALRNIHQFATVRGLSVLLVHHTVKGSRDGDPFDKVNGSRAFTATADSTLLLDHDRSGYADATLYGRGRDLIEFEFAMDFDGGLWSILGDAATVARSNERKAIIDALKDAPDHGCSPSDIATLTDYSNDNVRQMLGRMVKSGEVKKLGRGRYVLPGS